VVGGISTLRVEISIERVAACARGVVEDVEDDALLLGELVELLVEADVAFANADWMLARVADGLHVDTSRATAISRYKNIAAGVCCGAHARFAMLRGARVGPRLS